MIDDKLIEISVIVAEAANQDSFDTLTDDIDEALDKRKDVLERSQITCVMASEPGCLPDFWSASPIGANPGDIRDEIMTLMGEDDFEDEDTDWDTVRERVNSLDLAGSSINAPDGRVIEIFRKSCAEVLRDNGVTV